LGRGAFSVILTEKRAKCWFVIVILAEVDNKLARSLRLYRFEQRPLMKAAFPQSPKLVEFQQIDVPEPE
jgi:hypothetical protein